MSTTFEKCQMIRMAIINRAAEVMAAIETGEITPTQKYLLRVKGDNSPAELAHPGLKPGWQKDGSLVFEAKIVAKDTDRQFWQRNLLSTTYRFGTTPNAWWAEGCEPCFDFDFLGGEIGPGRVYHLGVKE